MSRRSRIPEGAPPLESVLEALIFAADTPISAAEMVEVVGTDEDTVGEAVEALSVRMEREQSGLQVEKVAGGFRIATRSDVGEWVRSLYRFRNKRRLSPASLETLAIIAYRQPITGPEIQQLRGVDPQGVLNNLLERRMLRIVGKKKVVGRPLLYGTTKEFLMHFGLDSLDDLPSLDAFGDILPPEEQESLFAGGPAASPDEVEPLEEGEETADGAAASASEPGGDDAPPPDTDETPGDGEVSAPAGPEPSAAG